MRSIIILLTALIYSSVMAANRVCEPDPIDLEKFYNQDECRGCQLECAELQGGVYDNKDLFYADLYEANLKSATFRGKTSFIETNLNTATLTRGYFAHVNFGGAQMLDVQAQYADFSHALLWGVNAMDSNFGGANLTGATLDDAIFQGSNLTDAQICQASSYSCMVHPSGAELPPCGNYELRCGR